MSDETNDERRSQRASQSVLFKLATRHDHGKYDSKRDDRERELMQLLRDCIKLVVFF
jgi:hypothetical protein